MSEVAINRLVALVRGRSRRGECFLVESGPDQFQLIVPTPRGSLFWESITPDMRATTVERALQLYLVRIEPVDWTEAPDELLATFHLPADEVPTLRLKTISPYSIEGRVSA